MAWLNLMNGVFGTCTKIFNEMITCLYLLKNLVPKRNEGIDKEILICTVVVAQSNRTITCCVRYGLS